MIAGDARQVAQSVDQGATPVGPGREVAAVEGERVLEGRVGRLAVKQRRVRAPLAADLPGVVLEQRGLGEDRHVPVGLQRLGQVHAQDAVALEGKILASRLADALQLLTFDGEEVAEDEVVDIGARGREDPCN